jgi:hypothetical protein
MTTHIITQPFFLTLDDCVPDTATDPLAMIAYSIWINFTVVGVGRLVRLDSEYNQYEVEP